MLVVYKHHKHWDMNRLQLMGSISFGIPNEFVTFISETHLGESEPEEPSSNGRVELVKSSEM